ncbi:MAG: cobyric acid synthase [Gemmatimonadales bacterium]|nr:cobyric acid synthase [Gemmatimonadales bacterium]MYG48965.1 cobyric acid synthase [Gemmatimonadales bacterium]MYK01373.1 cobyric acid synthase [Candidatus Palauibacter ramosifaciens]
MLQGTGSGVGKSLLTAAFCRLARRRGIAVAPFKGQNMSNNAAVTADGGEIGRAQALQARAAGLDPHVDMNPVLLKPLADTRSEVVRLGRMDRGATDLPWRERKSRLWPVVTEALARLRDRAELVIAEGAGSPAETNLRESDIVNMAVARHTSANVVLIADIDRGGAFASLYGTWALLSAADRALFRGFILNRFRGDPALLAPAPETLRECTGVPVLGVVPWIDHNLPEEDGGPPLDAEPADVPAIAAAAYPRASNLDDLDPLRREPGVRLRWVRRARDLAALTAPPGLAAIILPGSRNTLEDLRWMKRTGLADAIRGLATDGIPVAGLCAGYQIMGRRIADPAGIEGGGEEPGLHILDVRTELAPDKETRRTRARITATPPGWLEGGEGEVVAGYEIHHGSTRAAPGFRPWLADGPRDLGHADGPHWGCYLHGAFRNDRLRSGWLRSLGLRPDAAAWGGSIDRELDRLADTVERCLNIDAVFDEALRRPATTQSPRSGAAAAGTTSR